MRMVGRWPHQARALYNFQGENVGEISVREDEVLIVYSEHDIQGWPADPVGREQGRCCARFLARRQPQVSGSGDDDDWDDNSTVADKPLSRRREQGRQWRFLGFQWDGPLSPSTGAGGWNVGGLVSSSSAAASYSKSTAMVSRNLNRFATFVKSGSEAFILGKAAGFVKDGDKICVAAGPHGPEWQENPYLFACSVDEPSQQTKFKGIKSYIPYHLVPSHTQCPVNWRYKQFDWLYGRLVQKFPVISVPHIPEKQATSRFEEDFISKQKKGLTLWMNHMTSHPVLARCDTFQHFLTCNDEKAWKQGKRNAEKDDMVGGNFFLTQSPLDLQEVESRVDGFKTFTKRMDESVFQLSHTTNEFARK
uniref:sorting nexin-18-like n=1 Tax=Pristiophorus japonicus TaxID=55135 RepID=UPI00398E6EA6